MVENKIRDMRDLVLSGKLISRKRNHDGKMVSCYVSCPYYDLAMAFAKNIIVKNGVGDVILAPSIVANNRKFIFTSVKDKERINSIRNAKFKWRCSECDYFEWVYTDLYDIERTMKREMIDRNSNLGKHCAALGHSFRFRFRFIYFPIIK